MRRGLLAYLMAAALVVGTGAAMADPPSSDPTCGRGQQSGQECAGDNGAPGCEGIGRAEDTPADETPAAAAFDLVNDIINCG